MPSRTSARASLTLLGSAAPPAAEKTASEHTAELGVTTEEDFAADAAAASAEPLLESPSLNSRDDDGGLAAFLNDPTGKYVTFPASQIFFLSAALSLGCLASLLDTQSVAFTV